MTLPTIVLETRLESPDLTEEMWRELTHLQRRFVWNKYGNRPRRDDYSKVSLRAIRKYSDGIVYRRETNG